MCKSAIVGVLFLAAFAQAQDNVAAISGRIVDELGNPVAGAIINAGLTQTTSGPGGRFELRSTTNQPASLHFAADGYFRMIHTFAREDLSILDGDVGDIGLVTRKPQRRLLLFAGDAMLARRYFKPPAGEARLMRRGHELEDGKEILAAIKPYIELADYASVNMETQLSSRKLDDRLPKSITFWSPDELAQLLEWTGFDYVALGNNHTWDYQGQGLSSTYRALAKTELGHSGAGFDESSARKPWVEELSGAPFAFLSYVGWAGTFSPHQAAEGNKGGAALGGSTVFAEDLAGIPSSTTAVLQYHSGLEYGDDPAMSERTRLREAIDSGADIAIGHHPHVIQGLEIYQDHLIAYSMGNFLFDQYYYTTQLGMLLYVWMDGDRLHRAEVVPMYVNGYVPTPATGNMRNSILQRLARLSQSLGTCLKPSGAHAVAARCDDTPSRRIDLGAAQPGHGPIPLALLGVRPTEPVLLAIDGYQYRLGTDILPHGDFESAGRFDAPFRGWIRNEQVTLADGESRYLSVSVPADGVVRTGMSAFHRVFTPSNTTTLSGRVYADGPAVVRFLLQRRRPNTSTSDAFESGPTRVVGRLHLDKTGWHRFSFDFDQPRVATHSLRLFIDVADDPDHAGGGNVGFDDLAWTEWHTPWFNDKTADANFGTHVQFRALP